MKHAARVIVAALVAIVPAVAIGGELKYRFEGGDNLKVTAVADKQTWKVLPGENGPIVVVAALVQDMLILEQFEFGGQPNPEPQPGPGPGPQPGPQPQPVPGPKTVLWIEESSQRTPSQATAIIDATTRNTIRAAGWILRIVDVDVVDETGKTPPDLAPYIQAARQAGVPRLFILQDGRELFNGAAPTDAAAFRETLRRFGLPVGAVGDSTEAPGGPAAQAASEEKKQDSEASTAEPAGQPERVIQAAPCPSGQCPAPAIETRRWRLFR